MKDTIYEINQIDYDYIKRTKVVKYFNEACFSYISSSEELAPHHKMVVYIRKSCTPYENKEVIQWVKLLNENGFLCELLDLNHRIKVDTEDYRYYEELCDDVGEKGYIETYAISVKFKDFINKSHLLSTLYLIRYLQEDDLFDLPEKIMNAVKHGIDFIASIYLANHNMGAYGHNVITTSFKPHGIPTPEEFWASIRKDGNDLNIQVLNTQNVWKCDSIKPCDMDTLSKLFNGGKFSKLITNKEKIKETC